MSNEPIQNSLENSENLNSEIVIIKVGEEPNIKEFKVPSNILSAKSLYFETALSPRWAKRENGSLVFNKPNISPPVFEALINYINTEAFSDKNDVSLLDIFIAADEMEFLEIRRQVERRLLIVGSDWNLPKDFITMCKYNDTFPKLYMSALKFMRHKADEFLRKGKFLNALEFYEEIFENNHNDQTSALSWDLSGYKCGLKNLNELVNVLYKDTLLTSLNLAINNLGLNDGNSLASALCKNTTLTFLDLSSNRLGSEAGRALADALCENTALTSLNLSANKLGPECGKAFANALCKNTTLTSLNLYSNKLGSKGGNEFANALYKNTKLTTLNLGDNNLEAKGGSALAIALCENKTLTSLDLSANKLGPEGGRALANVLCNNTTLISLSLWNNKLGLEGAIVLADAFRKKNNNLRDLNLRCNNLGPGGGKVFVEALRGNFILKNLNLRNNRLGLEGKEAIGALRRYTGMYTAITSLDLTDN
ncbi:hypothetical protein C2G38_2197742 [Gigaspora rosea]|uniref:BTB domain-containing protein n=1 Tax=Gigaspora rosea TaxID=44941 RepID=A0A397UUJ4_9GLOM|nr:hypothetical protein C2G38_2197742 [Gigaspora rosea]